MAPRGCAAFWCRFGKTSFGLLLALGRAFSDHSYSIRCDELPVDRRGPYTECSTFVIITQQRSGSRYVVDQLSSHPQMLAAGELFINGSRVKLKTRAEAEHRPLHEVMEEHIDDNYAQR
jgi:hypothetical protein